MSILYFIGVRFYQKLDSGKGNVYCIMRQCDGVMVCTPLPKKEAKKQFTVLCKRYEEWAFNELRYKHEKEAQRYFDWRNSLKLVKYVEQTPTTK